MKKSSFGAASERRVIQMLGGRGTINSGAKDSDKGDGTLDGSPDTPLRIECKATVKESIGIQREWLLKINQEARETNRHPALTVSFVNADGSARHYGDWVMIPMYLFKEKFG